MESSSADRIEIKKTFGLPNPPKPAQFWDVEVNIMLDYRTDYTWAAIKLEFDNDMGILSGTMNKLRLEKAFIEGRLVDGDTFTYDAEIGRRFLINTFDSKVEFGSVFDGILFKISKAFESIGDFYFNSGALLVSEKDDHYAFVGELGMLKIGNIGFDLKYSVIDWKKPYRNELKNLRFNYVVQQLQLAYQFKPEWLGKRTMRFYAAGLNNMIADSLDLPKSLTKEQGEQWVKGIRPNVPFENFGKQNWGWYAGFSIGQARKMGDWSLDANYQWMQAQVVPGFDSIGIGRGNATAQGIRSTNIDGTGQYTSLENAVGPGNYKGFEVEVQYMFTDSLMVLENFKMSQNLYENLGPKIHYKQFEIEFVYTF